MGLIKCLDCDRHVSLNADHCQHCGNKRFREQYFERQKRWEEEEIRKKENDIQKAKELKFSSVEEMKKAEKTKEKNLEIFEWMVDNSTNIVITLAIIIFLLWKFAF
jgi:hypothetical protein